MIIARSPSALYSIHIFLKVGIVVYCEGGTSTTFEEATKPINAPDTLDTFYWRSLIEYLKINKNIHIKSVGCKKTINKIAEEVSRLSLSTITVCRDSDYDRALGLAPVGDRIAWTYGYSWENDVMHLAVIEKLVATVLGPGQTQMMVIAAVRQKTQNLERDLQPWVEIDASLCRRGKSAIFDRKRPLAAIDMTAPPSLRIGHLQQGLKDRGYRRRPKRVITVKKEDVMRSCYGKLISRALYQTFSQEVSTHIKVRIEYELFMRMAISETFKALTNGQLSSLASHINSQTIAFV